VEQSFLFKYSVECISDEVGINSEFKMFQEEYDVIVVVLVMLDLRLHVAANLGSRLCYNNEFAEYCKCLVILLWEELPRVKLCEKLMLGGYSGCF
jgi:hypothetical protein